MRLQFTASFWSLLHIAASCICFCISWNKNNKAWKKETSILSNFENRFTEQLLHDKLCNYCNFISKYWHKMGTKTDQKWHVSCLSCPQNGSLRGSLPPYPLEGHVLETLNLQDSEILRHLHVNFWQAFWQGAGKKKKKIVLGLGGKLCSRKQQLCGITQSCKQPNINTYTITRSPKKVDRKEILDKWKVQLLFSPLVIKR